jgi:hypothetical protein
MYSAELYPDILPHSHSLNVLQLTGKPIGRLQTTPTYRGIEGELVEVRVRFSSVVS